MRLFIYLYYSLKPNIMNKGRKILISIFCIVLGYAFAAISWGGTVNLGTLINTTLFCLSTPLIIGGIVYLIIALVKK